MFISGELILLGVEDFDRKLVDEVFYFFKDLWICFRKFEFGNVVVEIGWFV